MARQNRCITDPSGATHPQPVHPGAGDSLAVRAVAPVELNALIASDRPQMTTVRYPTARAERSERIAVEGRHAARGDAGALFPTDEPGLNRRTCDIAKFEAQVVIPRSAIDANEDDVQPGGQFDFQLAGWVESPAVEP